MPATAGRDWAAFILLNGNYVKFAGMRTRSMKVNSTNIDVTTADSPGRWREMLQNAGIQSLDMDIAGVFQNDSAAKAVLNASLTSTFVTLRMATPGIQIDGAFYIDNYEQSGPYNDAGTFSAKFMSSGVITVTLS